MNTGKSRVGIFILGMVLGFYWMFTYAGPYRYLAELQLRKFGSYSPKLTLLVICLLFFLLGELAKVLLRGAERPVPGATRAPSSLARDPRRETKIAQYTAFLVPAIVLVMGIYFFLTGMTAGSLRQVQASELADGALPSHTIYAEVHGYLDRKYLSQNNYLYIPMRETQDAKKPARMVVGGDDGKLRKLVLPQRDGSVAVRGMLEPQVDNEVRYAFEKNGMALGYPCWVLRTSRTPSQDKTVGGILMLVGVIFGGMLALRQSRQSTKPVPLRPLQSSTVTRP